MSKKKKKLTRPEKGRMIGGVCLALSDFSGLDVSLFRIVFALLLIPGGVPGLIPYMACWIIIPSRK